MAMRAETLQILKISEEELNNALAKDVQDVFTTMVGVDETNTLPFQVEIVTQFKECLTAMVGLAGTYNGLVSIHVPWPLATALTSQMLGMEVTEIDDDVNDAMGEIANMIAGSFKQHLSKGGSDVHLSTPSVVNGAEYTVNTGSDLEYVILKFETLGEVFIVSISIED